jgi:signal transduction histidine kinase
MRARSLGLRLMIGAMAAVAAALGVSWLAMTLLFERHIERRMAAELGREARVLLSELSLTPTGAPVARSLPRDPRFEAPVSGLYWQISTPTGTMRSRSLWDQTLGVASRARSETWSTRVGPGPFEARVFYLERRVRPSHTGPAVLIQVAQDEAQLKTSRQEFGRELAFFLALLWVVLSLAAWVQVRLGLKPLADVRHEVAGLRADPRARLVAAYPREIEPLTGAINALASAREADLVRARRRAADLAHGLKTPLAALAAQSRHARAAGAVEAADGLDQAITAVGSAIEAELARSRVATALQGLGAARGVLLDAARRVIRVVERTEVGERLVFEAEGNETATAPLPTEDVIEMLGGLIENAARFARHKVRVSVAAHGESVSIQVDDDGPGLSPERSAEAIVRGGRLDEAGQGHGLGLSIAVDLVEASGGALALERSALGGLSVRATWRGTK